MSIEPKPVDFPSIDEAILAYIDMRKQLRAHMSEAKDKEDEMKAFLEKVSMWLRDKGDLLGVNSFATSSGTAYRNTKKKYRIQNWDQFIHYVIESNNTQLLEKRVAKNAAVEIHSTEGSVPPGLEYLEEVEFNVLSPSKKKTKAKSSDTSTFDESDSWDIEEATSNE